ncbi:MAG: hypothetical protein M3Z35_17445 [Nitrospirota bacterium]|nr:hypothetical protein [Nitrospirota bacterium]
MRTTLVGVDIKLWGCSVSRLRLTVRHIGVYLCRHRHFFTDQTAVTTPAPSVLEGGY